MKTRREMESRLERSAKRTRWFMGAYFALMLLGCAWASSVILRACEQIEAEGGVGKAIGAFIGDVERGMEPTDD